jgi:NADPH:quinone reductase-like Zn-dependent oxidoreductase
MQAVRFHRHGGPEVLQLDEVPAPAPGPGEVRIAVRAAGVNFIDTYLRSGFYDSGALPAVAGREAAGAVDALGPGVDAWSAGDRVAFCDARGAYAESVTHAADRLVPLPAGVDFRTGAAALLQGFADSVRATRVRGHVVLFGQASGEPDPIRPRRLLGSRTLTSASLFDYVRSRDELLARSRDVFDWLAAGRLRLAIDSVLPLARAADAHRRLEGRASMGKILLEP